MISKPNNNQRPSRYEAARDPNLAEQRKKRYRKNWATTSTWSLPMDKLAKGVVLIVIVAFLVQTYIGASK